MMPGTLMPDGFEPPRFQWIRNTTVIVRAWIRALIQAKFTRIPNDIKEIS